MKLKRLLLQHLPLIYFIWAAVFMTLGTWWVSDLIQIPFSAQIIMIMSYLPLAGFCFWKFLCDVKAWKQGNISLYNILYYGFIVYFLGLTAFRFLSQGVWKDSLYFFLMLYGALAFAELIQKRHIPVTRQSLTFDIWAFAGFLLAYRLVYVTLLPDLAAVMPINLNIYASVLVFSLFTVAAPMEGKKLPLFAGIFILCAIVGIMLIGARALFALMLVAIAVIVLFPLIFQRNFRAALKRIIPIVCAFSIVAVLFVADYGNTRYAVYRETNLPFLQVTEDPTTSDSPVQDPETPDVSKPVQAPSVDKILATNQASRSDNMRGELLKSGIQEIKKNFFFGTGRVLFEYETRTYVAKNPAHNLIIETMNCFGFIGLLLLAAMVVLFLLSTGIFDLKDKKNNQARLTALCLLLAFCALGMIQAVTYEKIVLPFVLMGICTLQFSAVKKPIALKGLCHGKTSQP